MLFYKSINSTKGWVTLRNASHIWNKEVLIALRKVTQPLIDVPSPVVPRWDSSSQCFVLPIGCEWVSLGGGEMTLGDWANPRLWAIGFPVKLVTRRPLTCRGPSRVISNTWADENHLSVTSLNKLKQIPEEGNLLFNNIHSRPGQPSHKHPVKTFIGSQNRCHVQLISWISREKSPFHETWSCWHFQCFPTVTLSLFRSVSQVEYFKYRY